MGTVAAPQHLQALERANRIRLARAELKRAISGGERAVADVLREPPECAETMQVVDLLMAQRRWGRARARRLLLSAAVSELKTVGSLTARQVGVIAGLLIPSVASEGSSTDGADG